MQGEEHIKSALNDLKSAAPAGYAMALHVHYMTPKFLFQSYPGEWTNYYSQNGLVMQDPTVRWGFENTGRIRWSDLAGSDPAGVLLKAAAYGIKYGITIAIDIANDRSFASFARGDREFTDTEAASIEAVMVSILGETSRLQRLAPETCEALRKMSVDVTHPGLTDQKSR